MNEGRLTDIFLRVELQSHNLTKNERTPFRGTVHASPTGYPPAAYRITIIIGSRCKGVKSQSNQNPEKAVKVPKMDDARPPKPPVPVYRIYIDESGDHSYSRLEDPWHKYLGLLGLWFRLADDYLVFEESLTRLKRDVFGLLPDDHLVLHLSDIKGRKGAFGCLKDPETDRRFGDSLLRIVTDAKFTMVLALIDKKAHKDRYVYPMHPYHFSMMAICERYAFWLRERDACGDAMAESRGKREDAELNLAFKGVATNGTNFLKPTVAQKVFTSRELKVRHKDSDIAGLQLADLLAHTLKREALIERDLCPNRGGFARQMAAAARTKYRDCYGGSVTGRARVWL